MAARVIAVLQVGYLFFVVGLALIPFWPRSMWWLANFIDIVTLWVYLLPPAALAIMARQLKVRGAWAVNGVSALLVFFVVMNFTVSWPGSDRPGKDALLSVKVLAANLGNVSDARLFYDQVVRENPDIIVFEELAADVRSFLKERLKGDWNWSAGPYPQLAARFRIVSADMQTRPIPGDRHGMAARYALATPAGIIYVVGVHLITPRDGVEAFISRDLSAVRQMRDVTGLQVEGARIAADLAKSVTGPVIIAGDFNLQVRNPVYRHFWSGYQDSFSTRGLGHGYTKHTRWHGARIDHILCDQSWHVRAARVGSDVGGDHHPVIARLDLVVRPVTAAEQAAYTIGASPEVKSAKVLPAPQAPAPQAPVMPAIAVVLPEESHPETRGSLKVAIQRLDKDKKEVPVLVSTAIPFAQGQLLPGTGLAFHKVDGQEIPSAQKTLALWPDGSIRSVLVQFSSLIPGNFEYVLLRWGVERGADTADRIVPPAEKIEAIIIGDTQNCFITFIYVLLRCKNSDNL